MKIQFQKESGIKIIVYLTPRRITLNMIYGQELNGL